jgi:hypothetical protein
MLYTALITPTSTHIVRLIVLVLGSLPQALQQHCLQVSLVKVLIHDCQQLEAVVGLRWLVLG